MVEVKNLTKEYGKKIAVDQISFEMEKGVIYGLLGSNGASKSTTMNLITGYLAPTEGEILIGGYDLQKEPEKSRVRKSEASRQDSSQER